MMFESTYTPQTMLNLVKTLQLHIDWVRLISFIFPLNRDFDFFFFRVDFTTRNNTSWYNLIKEKKYCDGTCTSILEDSTQYYYSQPSSSWISQLPEQACKVCIGCTLNHNPLEMSPSLYASFHTYLYGFLFPLLPFSKISKTHKRKKKKKWHELREKRT